MSDGNISIYGHELTKKELLKRVGDISQIADIRLFEFTNGNERGVRAGLCQATDPACVRRPRRLASSNRAGLCQAGLGKHGPALWAARPGFDCEIA